MILVPFSSTDGFLCLDLKSQSTFISSKALPQLLFPCGDELVACGGRSDGKELATARDEEIGHSGHHNPRSGLEE